MLRHASTRISATFGRTPYPLRPHPLSNHRCVAPPLGESGMQQIARSGRWIKQRKTRAGQRVRKLVFFFERLILELQMHSRETLLTMAGDRIPPWTPQTWLLVGIKVLSVYSITGVPASGEISLEKYYPKGPLRYPSDAVFGILKHFTAFVYLLL